MKKLQCIIFTSIFIVIALLSFKSCDSPESDESDELTVRDDERMTIDNLKFTGAFRLKNGTFGVSDINYAVGTLAYNPQNNSLFIVGHAHQSAIAEYPIVPSGLQTEVANLPETGEPLQPFINVLDVAGNPEGLNRITGMLWVDGSLIVNAEDWYDAPADNADTMLVIADANNLAGAKDGYFELTCRADCAGYMGPIPAEWQNAFGAAYYTGWSSVYSIISRYSIGPSLWTFDPVEVLLGDATTSPEIITTPFMTYGYPNQLGDGTLLSDGNAKWAPQGDSGPFTPADSLWNALSAGRYGFFVRGTSTFVVIGSSAGLNSGIGYKIVQDNGNVCGGPCSYEADDYYNYYWLFDIQDILDADMVNQPKPYAYGIWEVPFDDSGKHQIIGATLDAENGKLYVALGGAGQLESYDVAPLILTYTLPIMN